MRQIQLDDLDDMALGSALLGSGGGGDPAYNLIQAKYQLMKYGPVRLMDRTELKPDDLVVPVGFMGAPLVGIEKIPGDGEFLSIFEKIERYYGKKASALIPVEIGGGNAFVPFAIAGQLDLPVLDGDTIGRAFPELQMTSCHLKGVSTRPAFIADSLGNTIILEAINSQALERIARHATVAMGSSSALAMYLMTGAQAADSIIPGTVSQALAIGRTLSNSQKLGKDPLIPLLESTDGACLGSGKITDIDQKIVDGFLKGTVTIQSDSDCMELGYQNEYLIAKKNGKVVATTPDILMLIEQESGTPITSESLQYGIKVNLIALPAPELWQTAEGLKIVGPHYFGYNVTYQKFERSQ